MDSKHSYCIVIASKNEEKYIGKCLDSICNLDYPKNLLQVLVYDGNSSDKTRENLELYSSKYHFIRWFPNPKQTAPHAFNLGIEENKSQILMILGAHSELYPNYLLECERVFKNNLNIGCVGGILENIYENSTSRAIGLAMSSKFGVGNVAFRTGAKDGFVDTVAFGAYRREVFHKVGLFDTELTRNQDDEFNFRLTQAGFKIWLSSSIRAKYYVRGNFKKLWRQYYQYGYWKVYVNVKHKTVTTLRQLFPALFVLGVICGSFLSCFSDLLKNLYLVTLILYVFLGVITAIRQSGLDFFKTFTAFVVLHFSYGLGYLEGVLRFVVLRKKPAKSHQTLSR